MAAASKSTCDLTHMYNATVLASLEVGDMVEFPRGLYSHWGVYIGDGKIVHLSGGDNDGINANLDSGCIFTVCGKRFNKAFVKIDDFWDVVLGCRSKKNNAKDRKCVPLQAHEIVEKAMSLVGEIGYNVLWNNCEHFASFIRYGEKWSEQANKALTGIVMAGAVSVITLLIGSLMGKSDKRESKD